MHLGLLRIATLVIAFEPVDGRGDLDGAGRLAVDLAVDEEVGLALVAEIDHAREVDALGCRPIPDHLREHGDTLRLGPLGLGCLAGVAGVQPVDVVAGVGTEAQRQLQFLAGDGGGLQRDELNLGVRRSSDLGGEAAGEEGGDEGEEAHGHTLGEADSV